MANKRTSNKATATKKMTDLFPTSMVGRKVKFTVTAELTDVTSGYVYFDNDSLYLNSNVAVSDVMWLAPQFAPGDKVLGNKQGSPAGVVLGVGSNGVCVQWNKDSHIEVVDPEKIKKA